MKTLLTRTQMMELARNNPGKGVSPCGCITAIDANMIEIVPGDLGRSWIVCLVCGAQWSATPMTEPR